MTSVETLCPLRFHCALIGSQGINFTGLVLQFVLYAGALLLYGSGGRVDAEKLHDETETEKEE